MCFSWCVCVFVWHFNFNFHFHFIQQSIYIDMKGCYSIKRVYSVKLIQILTAILCIFRVQQRMSYLEFIEIGRAKKK